MLSYMVRALPWRWYSTSWYRVVKK